MVEKTGKDGDGGVTHKLEAKWTMWFEKREAGGKQLTEKEWDSSLQKVGDFDTLEGYFMYYSHLQRPAELSRGMSYYLFRGDLKPTWENYPEGGHWTVTLQKSFDPDHLNRLWEQMSFALIGEEFNSPHLVGGVLSIKKDCSTLSVWSDQAKTKFSLGDNLRSVLNLGLNVCVEYKTQAESIKDASGRGGETYVIKTPNVKAGGNDMMPPAMDLSEAKEEDDIM
eukprot:TRINITY_DN486_c4_g1_i1.p2 TRINITY_DN486_c4_g1~~TRINITY_DN486_c4_g1_i1.p2  ORF type:complete len:236 (+),score=111.32 TRINITY_DN486_c4_g1_i1:37-708(+)